MATNDIKSYLVVNPSAGNDYYDVSGSVLSSSNQPTLNKGRATNLGTSGSTTSANMTRVALGDRGRTIFGSQVIISARQGVTGAEVSGTTALTSAANSSGLTDYTKSSHGLTVGTVIVVADTNGILSGPQRVVSVPDANSIVTDKPFATGAGTLTYGTVQGTFATMTVGNYIARKLSSVTLHGTSSTILRSGASDYGIRRSIHKVEHGRTYKVATAIRAGYWNEYSGVFSTAPSSADDSIGNVAGSTVTNGTADQAATPSRSVPGELVFRETGKQKAATSSGSGILLDDYEAKTS